MPDRFLSSGAMITFSIEDEDLLDQRTWRVWAASERDRRMVCADLKAEGRRYRLMLHREVAFRMMPELLKAPERLWVAPKNGNFLDVRRENLEITVRARKRGARRARGHRVAAYRGTQPAKTPPAWSRSGHRAATLGGDGGGGAAPH